VLKLDALKRAVWSEFNDLLIGFNGSNEIP
jgi:hypothetical protein